jgi:hypothetical protein
VRATRVEDMLATEIFFLEKEKKQYFIFTHPLSNSKHRTFIYLISSYFIRYTLQVFPEMKAA